MNYIYIFMVINTILCFIFILDPSIIIKYDIY